MSLRRLCKRAGIAYFSPSRIRHTTRERLEELVGLAASESVLGNADGRRLFEALAA